MAFTPLNRVLENLMKGKDFTGDLEAFSVFSLWPKIAGRRIAAHTRPARIKGRVLYLEVDDQLWLSQLKYMKDDILEKMGQTIKPGVFNDLKFLLKGL